MYYYNCPTCGSSLDPGEVCDHGAGLVQLPPYKSRAEKCKEDFISIKPMIDDKIHELQVKLILERNSKP